MISVFLDNIIFSLQKAGGASVVWQEHIGRLLCDNTITSTYLEYDNACENVFRKLLTIPQSLLKVRGTKGLFLKRYLDLNNQDYKSPYVFHSSHYRIDHSPKAINVTTVHDFTYEYFIPGIRKWIHSSQKWHAIKKSDAIICISESTKNDLLHFLPDINEAKIHVIHNGVNCTYRVLSPEDYKLDLPFADKEYILYVGSRLTSYKNFKSVVKVCSVLKIPLIMIGGEVMTLSERGELDIALGVGNYRNYRNVSVNDLNEFYNRAMLLLYPSFYEGFGIPIIESQRAGCPIIAYKQSSIPEIMGNTDYALSDISIDSIIEAVSFLSTHYQERENEINRGLENSQRFSWDMTYKKTIDLYKKIYEKK